MVTMENAWILPALPAGAFAILSLLNFAGVADKLPRKGDFIAIIAVVLAFLGFITVAIDLFDQLPRHGDALVNNTSGFDWVKIPSIDFVLRIGFRVDQITFVMLAAVSFVGMLVQIYSTGYMAHTDEQGHKHFEVRYSWYYAVLSLFIAAMLALVLADNFLLLYVAWEGVGICSFLLIGHYFERRTAAEAAKKAFITTRFGDVFLLIGIIMLWREAGTFDMSSIFHMAEEGEFGTTYLSVATLFLFGGAMGKSAQFPFHVWLPDAMEGPTPVSALIHAATMVVAGIYLVARAMPLFEASDSYVLYFVIAIGMITTFMSVGMGLVMTDIKRVVAYSTLNSLGLMMVSLGFGEHGVAPAMLYLFCHAFFKALLFLGCGSVIHGTDRQDVNELGGLADKLPITSKTILVGALAMAGVVPLSGFFAKDEVLVAAQDSSTVWLILLLITLPITAMYMLRLYLLTFTGAPKDQHVYEHAHESAPVMTVPLIVLSVFAVVAGFVVFEGIGNAVGFGGSFISMVDNALAEMPHEFHFDVPMAVISSALVVAGLGGAMYFWKGEAAPARAAQQRFGFAHSVLANKFYVDDFYQWVINNVALGFARVIAFFDREVVNDTGVNGPGQLTSISGWILKRTITGKLPNYALGMTLGLAVLLIAGLVVKG
jgi:NADH-quinone oxidoreductase subunit L